MRTTYDPVFERSEDGARFISAHNDLATTIPEPGLPFSLVFRAEPGREDALLRIASTCEAASKRRIPPPDFGPLQGWAVSDLTFEYDPKKPACMRRNHNESAFVLIAGC